MPIRPATLLRGWGGAPAGEVPALARLVSALSRFAVAHRADATEIELNPVLVHAKGEGLTVLDALLAPRKRA